MSELKKRDEPGKNLCGIDAIASSFSKRTPRDMGIGKARKYLKNNGLVTVSLDKGIESDVIKKQTYEAKMTQMLKSEQFEKHESMND